jgi:hypothetical protein
MTRVRVGVENVPLNREQKRNPKYPHNDEMVLQWEEERHIQSALHKSGTNWQ